MIDTHCHLTFDELHSRLNDVLHGARTAGVRGMITISTSAANAKANLALARAHADVWCSSGVHPLYADEPMDWDVIEETLRDERCVAWGELGLDCHYPKPDQKTQHRVLEEQLALIERVHAAGVQKPLIIHSRNSIAELVSILRSARVDPTRMVFHCFTAGPDEARMILDLGAWISFTGVLTFKNADPVRAAAELVPLDRVMVETDAPFLTPEPMRKVFPNEPKHVGLVAQRLAQIRNMDPARLEAVLDANAERFFGIQLKRQ